MRQSVVRFCTCVETFLLAVFVKKRNDAIGAVQEFYTLKNVEENFNAILIVYFSLYLTTKQFEIQVNSNSFSTFCLICIFHTSTFGKLILTSLFTVLHFTSCQIVTTNSLTCNTHIIFLLITSSLCVASLLGVLAKSVDRFLAVHLHVKYREIVSHKRVVSVVISLWLLSVFRSLMVLWFCCGLFGRLFVYFFLRLFGL